MVQYFRFLLVSLVFTLGMTSTVHAASFDCSKSPTFAEIIICNAMNELQSVGEIDNQKLNKEELEKQLIKEENGPIVQERLKAEQDPLRTEFIKLSEIKRKQIQSNLKDLGFYNSSIDGLFGKGTAGAISKYNIEKFNNVDLTDPQNLSKLFLKIFNKPTENKKYAKKKSNSGFSFDPLSKRKSYEVKCDPNYQATGMKIFGPIHGGDSVGDVMCHFKKMGLRHQLHFRGGGDFSLGSSYPYGELSQLTFHSPRDLQVIADGINLSGIDFTLYGSTRTSQGEDWVMGFSKLRLDQGRANTISHPDNKVVSDYIRVYDLASTSGARVQQWEALLVSIDKSLRERGFKDEHISANGNDVEFCCVNGLLVSVEHADNSHFGEANELKIYIEYDPTKDLDPNIQNSLNFVASVRNNPNNIKTKSNTDF